MAEEKKLAGPEKSAPPAERDKPGAPAAPPVKNQADKAIPEKPAPSAEKDKPGAPAVLPPADKQAGKAAMPGPGIGAAASKAQPEKGGPVGGAVEPPAKGAGGKVVDLSAKLGQEPAKGGDKKIPAPPGTPKTEKAGKQAKAGPKRDKVSQSKTGAPGKVPEQPAAGGPGSGPAGGGPVKPSGPPRPVADGKVVYLKISELHPFHTFRPHPFKVQDDDKMRETVDSIKANGVMVPGLARPEKDGGGYEIIAGHRRCRGSELVGLEEMPFIVRDMSDHEAVQAMKDSNKQRDHTLPSEWARLLDLEMEDIKHQGTQLKGVAAGDIGKRSAEIVGENNGMNYKKVMRYIRLNYLTPELLDKVDDKKMGFMPAVEISYIKPKNQQLIAVSIEGEQASPSVAQAKKLRELDQAGKLTGDVIDGILSQEKKEVERVIITTDELSKYFGKEFTPRQMKEQILSLLDDWKDKQPPEKAAPQKAAERG